ncbi:MAG: universal stress protein [Deltaproteobacteria bacterium]
MREIKKILVALAFAEYSKDVFNYATKLALDLGASLTAAHIIDIKYVEAISHVEAMGYEVSAEKYIESSKAERRTQLDELAKQAARCSITHRFPYFFIALLKPSVPSQK